MSVEEEKGPIAWMAKNSVAANLLMAVILVLGILGMMKSKQEVFPAFTLDIVSVVVPYPGASPEEVEQGILQVVEEELRTLEGIKRVTSTATENSGMINAELLLGANPDKVLADAKSAVDRIQSFPEEAEKASVSLFSTRQKVVSLVLSGDVGIAALHEEAELVRNRLLSHTDITQVEIEGVPAREIEVAISREQLKTHGLTHTLVAQQIRGSSLELPGGSLKTTGGEILVRVADRQTDVKGFSQILLRGTIDGGEVRLGDIAEITDGYEDTDLKHLYNGKPSVRVVAYRIGDETPQGVSNALNEVMSQLVMPEQIELAVWNDDSKMLVERIDLLVRNARLGLILVFLVLATFLNLRLALWVALGIPISILGAFALMPSVDVSINMISLFAFIITLGMVVDDAIIVGENIHDYQQGGMEASKAAIKGAKEMAVPVSFSILTTMLTFSPLLMIPGVMGKIFRIMPLMVIMVLAISWIESFFVLPSHLSHKSKLMDALLTPQMKVALGISAVIMVATFAGLGPALMLLVALPIVAVLQVKNAQIQKAFHWFSENIYRPSAVTAVNYRYITTAIAASFFILTVGIVGSGRVPRTFFPKLEGDVVKVSATLPFGSPVEQTQRVQRILEQSARDAFGELGDDAFRGMYSIVGEGSGSGGGPIRLPGSSGSHLLVIEVQLSPSSERPFSSLDFSQSWSAHTPPVAGVDTIKFSSSIGPGAGSAIDLQLTHDSPEVLTKAADEVAELLRSFPSLTDIENTQATGQPRIDFSVLPEAQRFSLTGSDVAQQVRGAFFGAEALREQQGRDEVKVMVRLPKRQRSSLFDLNALEIRTPTGAMVRLPMIAKATNSVAPTTIKREDGGRIINLKAELSASTKSSQQVLEKLRDELIPQLEKKYPGLEISEAGESREQNEAFGSMGFNFMAAMFGVYALLAIPLRSYIQPLVIMTAIPMGFVGAVGGHLLLGYELSFVSGMGIIALSGVVVNDSLVLLDATNRLRSEGATPFEAAISGAVRRLRPILLTSLTTFFGLAPMILETSVQARFLIPMAISLGFGVLFSTFVILLMVPSIYMIVEDLMIVVRRLYEDDHAVTVD